MATTMATTRRATRKAPSRTAAPTMKTAPRPTATTTTTASTTGPTATAAAAAPKILRLLPRTPAPTAPRPPSEQALTMGRPAHLGLPHRTVPSRRETGSQGMTRLGLFLVALAVTPGGCRCDADASQPGGRPEDFYALRVLPIFEIELAPGA